MTRRPKRSIQCCRYGLCFRGLWENWQWPSDTLGIWSTLINWAAIHQRYRMRLIAQEIDERVMMLERYVRHRHRVARSFFFLPERCCCELRVEDFVHSLFFIIFISSFIIYNNRVSFWFPNRLCEMHYFVFKMYFSLWVVFYLGSKMFWAVVIGLVLFGHLPEFCCISGNPVHQ